MFAPLHALDGALDFLPPAVRIGMYAAVVGAIAMLIYRLISPQKRLAALKQQISESQRAMRAYEGTDFREVMRLCGRSIALALKQLGLVFGPTLIAALPVIWVMAWLETSFDGRHILHAGPGWLRTWHATFMVIISVVALAMKLLMRIH
jgi:uncharacterized membrane protein (DUF106 family)